MSLLTLAAIGAIPIAWYGVVQGVIQRNTFPPSADPHHNAHWWAISALAFTGLLVLNGAGFGARGWRVGAAMVGLFGLTFGAASSVAPESASAVSLPWSIATSLWSLAVLAVVIRSSTDDSFP
jgi:hypothetical protein